MSGGLAPVEVERPEAGEVVEPDIPWIVIVWNDPINLMSYVTWVFQKLFGYPKAKAEKLMWDVHTKGKAVVANERRVLGQVASDFKDLLATETPSSDGSLQRVFPPAHPDDPIAELEYERTSGGALLAAKMEQLETLERCIGEHVLSEDDVLACMRAANDLRLVLGTRIDVAEGSTPADFVGDAETESTFE